MVKLSRVREALAQHSFYPPEVIIDGKIHRFSTNGKLGDKAGYYAFWDHGDGFIAGFFGDWRSGIYQTWHSKAKAETDPEDWKRAQTWADEAKKRLEKERLELAKKASEKAKRVLAEAKKARANNPYLKLKQVRPCPGLKQQGQTVLVPVMDLGGNLHGLQRIYPNGDKFFDDGTLVKGHFFKIQGEESVIYICEGIATGLSIHEATGCVVFCAFNCGNLKSIAQAVREKYPDARIVIAGDNDQWTEGNPGQTKAKSAAVATDAMVAILKFNDTSTNPTDFNDLHVLEGLEAVKTQLASATNPGEKEMSNFMITLGDALDRYRDGNERCYLWRRHIIPGYPHMLEGREYTGKTSIALVLAKETLTANPASCVLWIHAEGGLRDFLEKAVTLGLPGDRFILGRNPEGGFDFNFTLLEHQEALDSTCAQLQPVLVIIDSLRSISNIQLKSDRIGWLMNKINSIVCDRHNSALLYIHHQNKVREAGGRDRIYGTTIIPASVRLIYTLEKKTDYVRSMVCVKDNPGIEPPQLRVIKVADRMFIQEESAETKSKTTKTRQCEEIILTMLINHESVPVQQIYDACKEKGISESLARTLKDKLNIIHFKKDGVYHWQFPVSALYTDTFDTRENS